MAQVSGHGHSILTRSKAGGGVEAKYIPPPALEFGPSSFRVSIDTLSRGGTLKITTDTHDFGSKPIADKPLFVWIADDGDAPNSVLGRSTQWANGAATIQNGASSTEQVGYGQSSSWRSDMYANERSLDIAEMGNSDKHLMCRRRFDDFDVIENRAIRVRVERPNIGGTSPNDPEVGEMLEGINSGAKGIIQSVQYDGNTTNWAVYLEPNQGTTYQDETNPSNIDFIDDEPVQWGPTDGTNITTVDAQTYCREGAGTYRTFNNKSTRLFPAEEFVGYGNIYAGENDSFARVVTELGASSGGSYNGPQDSHDQRTLKQTWVTDLFRFKESSAQGVADGYLAWKKNQKTLTTQTDMSLTTITATYPNPKRQWFQLTVSNGCQPGTAVFHDYVLIDDSWYFVTIVDSVSDRELVLPTSLWRNQEVNCAFLPFEDFTHVRLYKDGVFLDEAAR